MSARFTATRQWRRGVRDVAIMATVEDAQRRLFNDLPVVLLIAHRQLPLARLHEADATARMAERWNG